MSAGKRRQRNRGSLNAAKQISCSYSQNRAAVLSERKAVFKLTAKQVVAKKKNLFDSRRETNSGELKDAVAGELATIQLWQTWLGFFFSQHAHQFGLQEFIQQISATAIVGSNFLSGFPQTLKSSRRTLIAQLQFSLNDVKHISCFFFFLGAPRLVKLCQRWL